MYVNVQVYFIKILMTNKCYMKVSTLSGGLWCITILVYDSTLYKEEYQSSRKVIYYLIEMHCNLKIVSIIQKIKFILFLNGGSPGSIMYKPSEGA